MVDALAGFENYINYLATGKLDVYLDSIKSEDKLTGLGVDLPLEPNLLLHDLGKHQNQERIKNLFHIRDSYIRDTVFVMPG